MKASNLLTRPMVRKVRCVLKVEPHVPTLTGWQQFEAMPTTGGWKFHADKLATQLGFDWCQLFARNRAGNLFRSKAIVTARAKVFAALRAKGLSYPEVGRATNSNHTTVLYALRCAQRRGEM
jgi:hypothetical protein